MSSFIKALADALGDGRPDGRCICLPHRRINDVCLDCGKQHDPPPPAPPPRAPIPTTIAGVGLRVAVAMHPSDRGNSAGSGHYTVTAELHFGRLHRLPGEALCRQGKRQGKPLAKRRSRWSSSSGFWGLADHHDDGTRADCVLCLEIAERLGVGGV